MKSELVLPAPAKLNLFLHIIGRRPDGYHALQTLFQFLDYGDELTFSLQDTLELQCNLPELVNDDNLIFRAARLLQQETGTRKGALVQLNKRLPMGGGVGGGEFRCGDYPDWPELPLGFAVVRRASGRVGLAAGC